MKRLICLAITVILLLQSAVITSFAQSVESLSVSASETFGTYLPEYVIDDDLNTRWAIRSTTGWITLDMGVETAIDTVELIQLADSIKSLDIMYSNNGEGWSKATSYEMESTENANAFYKSVINFECVNARFIKVSVNDAGAQSYINICELRAYYSGTYKRTATISDFDTDRLPNDIIASSNLKKIRMVLDLGVMESISQTEFGADKPITRAELAYAAYIMRGRNDIIDNSITDVPETDKYYPAVSYAVNSGFMSVDENGRFYPDDSCNVDMVSKVMVAVLGYNDIALMEGGYPEGYRQIASKNGLYDGIGKGDMNRIKAAVMFANTLDANVMVEKLLNGSDKTFDTSRTSLLNAGMGLLEISGQVKAVNGKSIDVNVSAGENTVVIGESTYIYDDTYIDNYLGYAVDGYCTDDDDPKVVAVYLNKKNSVIRIYEEDLVTGDDVFSLSYYKDNSNSKTKVKLSRSINAVYNGTATGFEYSDLEESNLLSGYIDLIDIDNDKVFDVIFISKYDSYSVNSISESAEKIYCNNDVVLDLSEYDEYLILKNDSVIPLNELAKNNTVSLFEDKDKKQAKLIVTENVIKGDVSLISDEVIEIDGAEYKIGTQLKREYENGTKGKPGINVPVIAYADFRNMIFSVDYDSLGKYDVYAYLVGAAEPEGIDNGKLKLYTSNGDIKLFDIADKIKINKVSRRSDDVFNDPRLFNSSKVVVQLVKFRCNSSGAISSIETAKRKKDYKDIVNISQLTEEEKQIQSKRYSQESAFFSDETFTINADDIVGTVRNGNMSLDSMYFYNTNTLIFKIPVNRDDLRNINYLDIWNSDNMSNKSMTKLTFSTYDEDDFSVAKVIVIHEGSANNAEPDKTSYVITVGDKKEVYNELEGDTQTAISGLVKGLETQLVPTNEIINALLTDTECGDVIRFRADSNSRIYGIKRAFSLKYMKEDLLDDGGLNLSVLPKPDESFDYHIGNDMDSYEQICGIVEKVDDDRALIRTSKNGIEQERVVVYKASTVFTSYNGGGRKTEVRSASKNDVLPGNYIYARCEFGSLREAVVFDED